MKVIAINGSPRKDGNTARLIKAVFEPLVEAGISTEFIQLGGEHISGCIACLRCRSQQDNTCSGRRGDAFQEIYDKMVLADGIIIGSPTYFSGMTSEVKALIDRAGYVALSNGRTLRRKVGAAVVVHRRAGAMNVFDGINKFFHINQMVMPGSTYWNLGVGRERLDVEKDPEGLRNMRDLGENIAWLLQKLRG